MTIFLEGVREGFREKGRQLLRSTGRGEEEAGLHGGGVGGR